MPRSLALTLLGAVAALPLLASAQTTWTGTNLTISGNRQNGCDIRVLEVSHSGSTLSSMRFGLINRAASEVRVVMEVTLAGQGQRKMGAVSGLVGGGQTATLQGFYPFGGSLKGSTVGLRFTACTPA